MTKLCIDVEIPQFAGWEFDRLGNPSQGEAYYHAPSHRLETSGFGFNNGSFRLVYKKVQPLERSEVKIWYPSSLLKHVNLQPGEIILFRCRQVNGKNYSYSSHWIAIPTDTDTSSLSFGWPEFTVLKGTV